MPLSNLSKTPTDLGSYDYIIVGAGSAGCVLANRLGEDPNSGVGGGWQRQITLC